MFRVFQEEKLIAVCMFACLGISVFLRLLLGLLYRNMIKEADNMATTKNKLLRQCKTKFASCYQLSNGVANIPVFVDKFLNRMALGHLSFETLYHLSGQMMLLSVVFSGVGVCKSIAGGRTLGEVLPFYIVSFFGLYIYFSVSTVVDIRGKKRVLKVNLVDYLENHLSPRIEITRQDMEMLYGEAAFEEGRRTVELMPIGNRMAAGGEDLAQEEPEESPAAAVPLTPAASAPQPFSSTAASSPQSLSSTAASQPSPIQLAESGSMGSDSEDSAAVTEEELEALLKEFLTS